MSDLDQRCINTIRFLSVDAIQKANSGHPGLPMGAAAMAYALWTRFLKHNPANPLWPDRDRFVLSAGHGSMLLYSLLHLTGYDLSLDDLKLFRQWGSKTPGHPERGQTPGVETTTGPLGQGFGNGVGMAIAERYLAEHFNRPGYEVVNHWTYAIAGDGDLMEGVSAEAASLAGHLKLGKLIYLYDNNHICLSGATHLSFSEDVRQRFQAYGWNVRTVDDGNDPAAVARALAQAKRQTSKPSLIMVHTHIGYGAPHKQDTFEAHGAPLGVDEVRLAKENLGWPLEPAFFIPADALGHFRKAVAQGRKTEAAWNALFAAYAKEYPDAAKEFKQLVDDQLPAGWDAGIPTFAAEANPKGMATRVASSKALNAVATKLPSLIGGSADLNPSTLTAMAGLGNFESPSPVVEEVQGAIGGGWNYGSRNIHFGVREHAMGSIVNGIAAHGGLMPFASTFLVFCDYMRPTIRLAALMGLHVIYVFTHDSIGVGEDGPTHEPVEQTLSLRLIPGMTVIRPADANETATAWRVAIEHKNGPVALILTRQNLPVLDPARYPGMAEGVRRGGYILADSPAGTKPQVILVATGSEVQLALAARDKLAAEGIQVRVVSLPSWNLFDKQPLAYRRQVAPDGIPMLAIEAGVGLGWRPYIGPTIDVISLDRFGASAPGDVAMREFGFTADNVCAHVRTLLHK
jgi:transketolase